MDRRAFLGALSGFLAAPLVAGAQQAGKVPRIGYLSGGSRGDRAYVRRAFSEGLRDLGWIEGQNILVEERWAEGKSERNQGHAAELVALKVDVIVAGANPETRAARQATSTIPIVMIIGADPVGQGFISSVRRPGGNITGTAWDPDPVIMGKYVEFLKDTVPGLQRIGGIADPVLPLTVYWNALDQAARRLGLMLHRVEIGAADEIETAFATVARGGARAVFVQGSSLFFLRRRQIAAAAAKHKLADIYISREWVEAGGLMSYGVSLTDLARGAASYVDRILKGAKPADLPVEAPNKFELVINLKTAKALGLTIPQSLLQRADQVIE